MNFYIPIPPIPTQSIPIPIPLPNMHSKTIKCKCKQSTVDQQKNSFAENWASIVEKLKSKNTIHNTLKISQIFLQ